jgi:preprotein translocase subunit SecD
MRDQRGRPFVRFTLTEAGTKKLETLTRRNPGDWILFSMDDSFMGVTRIAGVVADGSLDIGMDSEQSARYVASKVGAAPQADNDATNRPNANNPGSLETVAPEIPARAGVR